MKMKVYGDNYLKDPSHSHSSFWKGIIAVKDNFMANMKFSLGWGEKIRFWHDLWIGNTPLVVQFPNIFNCVKNRKAKAVII